MENMWRNLNKKTSEWVESIQKQTRPPPPHPQQNKGGYWHVPEGGAAAAIGHHSSPLPIRTCLISRTGILRSQIPRSLLPHQRLDILSFVLLSSVRGEPPPQLSPQQSRDWKQLNIRKYSYQWMWKALTCTSWLIAAVLLNMEQTPASALHYSVTHIHLVSNVVIPRHSGTKYSKRYGNKLPV